MKKFIVVLIGIYLILIGVLGLLILLVGLFLSPKTSSAEIAKFDFFKVQVLIISSVFALWPVITGLGIILRKNWARFSAFVISVFAIFTGLLISLLFLFVPSPQNSPVDYKIIKLIILGFFFVFFIAIPLFFVIFFTRKSVEELFVSKKPEGESKAGRPFGITLLAIFNLLGSLFFTVFAFRPFFPELPLVGDILLSGTALKAYFFVFALISLYIGIGFLKRKKTAWLMEIILNGYAILLGMANIFTISEATLTKRFSSIGLIVDRGSLGGSLSGYKLSAAIGLLISIVTILYLVLKRSFFFVNKI